MEVFSVGDLIGKAHTTEIVSEGKSTSIGRIEHARGLGTLSNAEMLKEEKTLTSFDCLDRKASNFVEIRITAGIDVSCRGLSLKCYKRS